MKRFSVINILLILFFIIRVSAKPITWVEFRVPSESLEYALEQDIKTSDQDEHINWIDILAVSACRTSGKCDLNSVKQAAEELRSMNAPEEILKDLAQYYGYYLEAFSAVLGGLVGNYAIYKENKWIPYYGLKAFSPIADNFSYRHYKDFGAGRSFGYPRKHLGNDLIGAAGTPIVAIEGGTIEAMGWNRYGGWRIGIRSHDNKRYYYYAHLLKDSPYASGLKIGDEVAAGGFIGYMGRTGYSDIENTNNIEIDHLHLGLQLIFDESQKDSDNEIWVDVYPIVQLLSMHKSTLCRNETQWKRVYPFIDLDRNVLSLPCRQ